MELILFFTDSNRLSDIGVLLPWSSEKWLHQFKVLSRDMSISRNQQIWVVWDKISFKDFVPHLNAIHDISEIYYVHHSYPLEDFRNQLEDYLKKRKIFYERQNSPQIPNCNSTFEAISSYAAPFTTAHFTNIIERIYPCKRHIYKLLNQLDARKGIESNIKLLHYPAWLRAIYSDIMAAVTPENFELKRNKLQTELEKYCQNRSLA